MNELIRRREGCTGEKRIACDDLYADMAYTLGGGDGGDSDSYGKAKAKNDLITVMEIEIAYHNFWREVTQLATELGCQLGTVDRDIRIGRELKLRTWENPLPPEQAE